MNRRLVGSFVSGLVSVSMLATLAGAAPESATPNVLHLKSGPCTFRLLDSTGTKPQSGAALCLVSAEDLKPVASIKADDNGNCALTIAAGRYVLSVNEMNLAVLMASNDATLTDCRILLPAEPKPMPVGGAPAPQGEGSSSQRRGGAFWTASRTLVIGGTVILVGAAAYTVADYLGDRARREDDREDRRRVSQ